MTIKKTLLAVSAVCISMAAQAAEFRSADVHNADDYPTVLAVKHMSTVLEKASGGKHKIKVFNKGALGSEKETIDQVKIGALDMVRVNVAPMNGVCPMTMVPTMPFLFRSVDHMRKALDGPIGDEILRSCESAGYIGLAFYDSGARSIYAKKAVRTVADAKGMKIRVQQSDLWVGLVSAMGANATPMPYGEVYTGLNSMAPEILVFSKVVWDKLPKAEQDMIRAAAKDSVRVQRAAWDDQEGKSLARVKAAGVQIVEVDKKSFQSVMAPVYDRFMTTPDMKRLVKAIQDIK
jgi:TRAP-type C4-dicarboxylate transport system substrate-binding protein